MSVAALGKLHLARAGLHFGGFRRGLRICQRAHGGGQKGTGNENCKQISGRHGDPRSSGLVDALVMRTMFCEAELSARHRVIAWVAGSAGPIGGMGFIFPFLMAKPPPSFFTPSVKTPAPIWRLFSFVLPAPSFVGESLAGFPPCQ